MPKEVACYIVLVVLVILEVNFIHSIFKEYMGIRAIFFAVQLVTVLLYSMIIITMAYIIYHMIRKSPA